MTLNAETLDELPRVMQTKFGDPDGNCLEACFATLTGIPLDEFPHYLQDAWFFHYKRWLRERGWHIEYFDGKQAFPGYAIASGPAARGLDHSTIYRDGKLYHDPHPSGDGLLSVDDYILVWPALPYVRRLQAVADSAREHHDDTWCGCRAGDEVQCELGARLAALGEEPR